MTITKTKSFQVGEGETLRLFATVESAQEYALDQYLTALPIPALTEPVRKALVEAIIPKKDELLEILSMRARKSPVKTKTRTNGRAVRAPAVTVTEGAK